MWNIFKFKKRSIRCGSGVFIVKFAYIWHVVLNLSKRYKSPVTFKVKLYVTTVKNLQALPIFCHKELLLRCCIRHSVHWGINSPPSKTPLPSFLPSSPPPPPLNPLNLKTDQAPPLLFRQPSYILVFHELHSKNRIFQWTPKTSKVFHT